MTAVANVGEQRPNQDSKVFEVKIEVEKADTTLRPGMTTANAIEIASVPNVLSIPLEAVTSEGGYSYAFKKSGRGVVKQMIETGAMNDNEIVVKKGLTEEDRVLPDAAGRTRRPSRRRSFPGLQPTAPPGSGGDTAKAVTLPAKSDSATRRVQARAPRRRSPATKPKG